MSIDLQHALDTALRAARLAGAIIEHYAGQQSLGVMIKPDATPVTRADIEAEAIILATLRAEFPDHAYYGEETGHSDGDGSNAEWLWLIDPLDGTKSFVRGYAMYSTQIALMHRGELVLGVSHASRVGETAWAIRGQGAFRDGHPLKVATTAWLSKAHLSTGNLKTLTRGPGWAVLAGLIQDTARIRGYGDFWHYHRLAEGSIDLVLESDVNILDIAALAVIVREAGGTFTDLSGAELTLATTSVLAGVPALHAEVLARLQAAR